MWKSLVLVKGNSESKRFIDICQTFYANEWRRETGVAKVANI